MKLKDFILKLEEFELINQDLIIRIWDAEHSEANELNDGEITIIGDSLVLGRGELEWYEKPREEDL